MVKEERPGLSARGDYCFGNKIPGLSLCQLNFRWIWYLGRQLFEETDHRLGPNDRLVAFIPRYEAGGTYGLHQDSEPEMKKDWILSLSFGASAVFSFSPFKKGPFRVS